jgi:dihydropyrimidinase
MTVKGCPSHTLSQGKIVYKDGKLDVERGAGRYVDRPPFAPYYDALLKQAKRAEPSAVQR